MWIIFVLKWNFGHFPSNYRKTLKSSSEVRYVESKGYFILEDNDALETLLESREVPITNYDIVANNKGGVNNEKRSVSIGITFRSELGIKKIKEINEEIDVKEAIVSVNIKEKELKVTFDNNVVNNKEQIL